MFLGFRQMSQFLGLAVLEMPGQIQHDRNLLNHLPKRRRDHEARIRRIHQQQETTHVHKEQLGTCHTQGILRRGDHPFQDRDLLDSCLLHIVDTGSNKKYNMGSSSKGVHMGSSWLGVVAGGLVGIG
jgi:hypothetical protein